MIVTIVPIDIWDFWIRNMQHFRTNRRWAAFFVFQWRIFPVVQPLNSGENDYDQRQEKGCYSIVQRKPNMVKLGSMVFAMLILYVFC
jgi:hypothetical protein